MLKKIVLVNMCSQFSECKTNINKREVAPKNEAGRGEKHLFFYLALYFWTYKDQDS